MVARQVAELGGNILFSRNGEIQHHALKFFQLENLISDRKLRNIVTILIDFGRLELFQTFKQDPELRFFTNYIVYYISGSLTLYFLNDGDVKISIYQCSPDQEPMCIYLPLQSFERLIAMGEKFRT